MVQWIFCAFWEREREKKVRPKIRITSQNGMKKTYGTAIASVEIVNWKWDVRLCECNQIEEWKSSKENKFQIQCVIQSTTLKLNEHFLGLFSILCYIKCTQITCDRTYRHRDSTLSNQTTKQLQIINHHANILFRFIRICLEMRIVIVYSVDFIHFFFCIRAGKFSVFLCGSTHINWDSH